VIDQPDPRSSARSGPMGLVVSCAVLALVVLLAFPAFAWFGFSRHGHVGLLAAATAGVVCFVAAAAALAASATLRGPKTAVHGALLGIAFRTGLPLMAGFVLMQRGGPLAEAGVFGMIVVYFLITLTVETLLAVRLLRPRCKISKAL